MTKLHLAQDMNPGARNIPRTKVKEREREREREREYKMPYNPAKINITTD